MLSLNKLREILVLKIFTKRNIFLLTLVAVNVFLGIILLKKTLVSTIPMLPPVVIKPKGQEEFVVQKFLYTTQPNLPTKTEVPKLKEGPVFDLEIAKKIAKDLGFEKGPKSQNDPISKLFFEWQEDNYLVYYPLDRKITYYFNTQKKPAAITEGTKPTEASAQKRAEEFLQGLGLWDPNFRIIKTVKLSGLGTELPQNPVKEVNVVELWYGSFWQNSPILTLFPTQPWVKIQVARENTITKLEYQKPPLVDGTLGNRQLLTANQALGVLNQGQGTVASLDLENSLKKPLTTKIISAMEIEKTSLAYLFSTDNQDFLAPIFVFEGKITTSDQRTGQAIVYLPAT